MRTTSLTLDGASAQVVNGHTLALHAVAPGLGAGVVLVQVTSPEGTTTDLPLATGCALNVPGLGDIGLAALEPNEDSSVRLTQRAVLDLALPLAPSAPAVAA